MGLLPYFICPNNHLTIAQKINFLNPLPPPLPTGRQALQKGGVTSPFGGCVVIRKNGPSEKGRGGQVEKY
jgi:hypothetical protein